MLAFLWLFLPFYIQRPETWGTPWTLMVILAELPQIWTSTSYRDPRFEHCSVFSIKFYFLLTSSGTKHAESAFLSVSADTLNPKHRTFRMSTPGSGTCNTGLYRLAKLLNQRGSSSGNVTSTSGSSGETASSLHTPRRLSWERWVCSFAQLLHFIQFVAVLVLRKADTQWWYIEIWEKFYFQLTCSLRYTFESSDWNLLTRYL